MGELSPPIICRGCGRPMLRPFGPGQLTFRYREAETLLRVLEHDALVHLYAMRFFARPFEAHFYRPSLIYGMYPGMDFYERGSDHHIGEADVVIPLSDGSFVIGECKRDGAGLNDSEIQKLDALAERLGSPWTFLATSDASAECPHIWPASQRLLPDPPRFCISAEQLFEPMVFWAVGANPLRWAQQEPEVHAERESMYRDHLSDAASWLDD
jgi:hypothetical protein